MMLSYNCQVFFFFVRGEMMHKTTKRIRKVVFLLLSLVCLIFVGMCYAAYFSLGKNSIPVLYTLRKKISEDSKDYMMLGAQVLFTVAAFFKIALIMFPAREQIYIFYKMDRSFRNHMTITVVMCLAVFAIPCFYPDVTKLLGLFGGITAGTVGYSLPLFLKLVSLQKRGFSLNLAIHLILLVCVLVIQTMSVYVSLAGSSSGGH